MEFMDKRHEAFYNDCLGRGKCAGDCYRRALFYTLGLNEETRKHVDRLYDFRERGIRPEGLADLWEPAGGTASLQSVQRILRRTAALDAPGGARAVGGGNEDHAVSGRAAGRGGQAPRRAARGGRSGSCWRCRRWSGRHL